METKYCSTCKKELAIDMFDSSFKNTDGYEHTCKECKRKSKEYYHKNKEKLLQKCAEYRQTHKEQKALQDKKYAETHKEQRQQYQKEYRESHKLSNAEYQKQYRINNKERLDEYKKSPHSRYMVYQRNAKKKNRDFQLSEEEFVEISNLPCTYCGEYSDTYNGEPFNGIDRIDSNIGYVLDNCVSCCATCNRMKMDLGVAEWISKMQQILNYYNQ